MGLTIQTLIQHFETFDTKFARSGNTRELKKKMRAETITEVFNTASAFFKSFKADANDISDLRKAFFCLLSIRDKEEDLDKKSGLYVRNPIIQLFTSSTQKNIEIQKARKALDTTIATVAEKIKVTQTKKDQDEEDALKQNQKPGLFSRIGSAAQRIFHSFRPAKVDVRKSISKNKNPTSSKSLLDLYPKEAAIIMDSEDKDEAMKLKRWEAAKKILPLIAKDELTKAKGTPKGTFLELLSKTYDDGNLTTGFWAVLFRNLDLKNLKVEVTENNGVTQLKWFFDKCVGKNSLGSFKLQNEIVFTFEKGKPLKAEGFSVKYKTPCFFNVYSMAVQAENGDINFGTRFATVPVGSSKLFRSIFNEGDIQWEITN